MASRRSCSVMDASFAFPTLLRVDRKRAPELSARSREHRLERRLADSHDLGRFALMQILIVEEKNRGALARRQVLDRVAKRQRRLALDEGGVGKLSLIGHGFQHALFDKGTAPPQ